MTELFRDVRLCNKRALREYETVKGHFMGVAVNWKPTRGLIGCDLLVLRRPLRLQHIFYRAMNIIRSIWCEVTSRLIEVSVSDRYNVLRTRFDIWRTLAQVVVEGFGNILQPGITSKFTFYIEISCKNAMFTLPQTNTSYCLSITHN